MIQPTPIPEFIQTFKVVNTDGSQPSHEHDFFILRLDPNGDYLQVQASRKALNKFAECLRNFFPEYSNHLKTKYPFNPSLIVADHFEAAGFQFEETGSPEWNLLIAPTSNPVILNFGKPFEKWQFSLIIQGHHRLLLNCETIDEAIDFVNTIEEIIPNI